MILIYSIYWRAFRIIFEGKEYQVTCTTCRNEEFSYLSNPLIAIFFKFEPKVAIMFVFSNEMLRCGVQWKRLGETLPLTETLPLSSNNICSIRKCGR